MGPFATTTIAGGDPAPLAGMGRDDARSAHRPQHARLQGIRVEHHRPGVRGHLRSHPRQGLGFTAEAGTDHPRIDTFAPLLDQVPSLQRQPAVRGLRPADPDRLRGGRRERRDQRLRHECGNQTGAAAQRRLHRQQGSTGIVSGTGKDTDMTERTFVDCGRPQRRQRSQ